jgi:O-antigen/teichoic acid export membrane protein
LLITYINGFFLGKNEIKIFSNISWLPYLITFLGAVVLIIVLNYEITGAILAYIAGPFILFLVCYFKFLSKIQFAINFEIKVIKALLSLGLVYAFALIINVLNYSFDAILLDKLSTSYELGIYARGAGLAQYLWQIPLILGTIVFARSSISKDGRKYSLKALQLMRLSFVVVMVLCALLYFVSPLVIHLLYGPEFSGSVNILRILLPGVLLLTTFKVLNMDLAGKGKPLIAVKAMLPALLINIVLNILWIPKYGGRGAAVASMISYTFATLLFVFFYSNETKISLRQIIFYKKSDFAPIVNFVAKIF